MSGPTTSVTRTQVLGGPGQMWWGLASTATEPDDLSVGSDPGMDFTDVGGTDGGMTITINQSFFTRRVDQVPDAVGKQVTERTTTASTSLAEATLENLALALNVDPADIATTSDTTNAAESLEPETGIDAMRVPHDLILIVDGWAPGDVARRRRFILRRVNSVDNVGSTWQKDGLYLIPVTMEALFVDNTTPPFKIVDEKAAP